jgi:hypothetical protein
VRPQALVVGVSMGVIRLVAAGSGYRRHRFHMTGACSCVWSLACLTLLWADRLSRHDSAHVNFLVELLGACGSGSRREALSAAASHSQLALSLGCNTEDSNVARAR